MATIVSGKADQPVDRDLRIVRSNIEIVANTIQLEAVSPTIPHTFISVQFFADAAGAAPATPGAGTVTVTVRTINSQVFEAIPDNVIDATAILTISVNANVEEILLVPAGLTVATHWRAVVSQNRA